MGSLVSFVNRHVKAPLIELLTPPCKAFSAPFYALYEDGYTPAPSLYPSKNVSKIDTKAQPRQTCEKILRSIVRIGMTSAVFYAYDKTWSYGNYYFGVAGGLMGFVVCLSVLHAVDPKSNDLGRSIWFLFRGTISLIQTFGDSRAALLCLVLVREKEYKREQGLLSYGPVKNTIKSIASWAYPNSKTEPGASPEKRSTFVVEEEQPPQSPESQSEEEES